MGIRRRRSRAAASSTQTTNGTSSIAIVTCASQPRGTFPGRNSAGSPPRSMVTAASSSATTLTVGGPTRPAGWRRGRQAEWSGRLRPAVIVTAGMPREISGPCSCVVYGDGVAGELVEQPRCRAPARRCSSGGRRGRRRRPSATSLRRVGADQDPQRRPGRGGHGVEHDRRDDPRPQRPGRANSAAPCAPVVPPSVETNTRPRSGGTAASSGRARASRRCRLRRRRSSRRGGRSRR